MTELMGIFARLAGLAEPVFLSWFVVFLRVSAAVALLPAFGEATLPARVRLGIAIAFSLIVLPAVAPAPVLTPLLMLAEMAVGAAMGLALRFLVFALQTAGAIIAQSISLAQLFGGAGEPQPVVGHFLTVAGLALAVALGLHVRAAQMFILSYDLLPVGAPLAAADFAQWSVAQAARCLSLGLSLAAPFVIAALVYNMALGVINRAMPQLTVAMIGAPAITLGGIALLAMAAPVMLHLWHGALETTLSAPLAVPK